MPGRCSKLTNFEAEPSAVFVNVMQAWGALMQHVSRLPSSPLLRCACSTEDAPATMNLKQITGALSLLYVQNLSRESSILGLAIFYQHISPTRIEPRLQGQREAKFHTWRLSPGSSTCSSHVVPPVRIMGQMGVLWEGVHLSRNHEGHVHVGILWGGFYQQVQGVPQARQKQYIRNICVYIHTQSPLDQWILSRHDLQRFLPGGGLEPTLMDEDAFGIGIIHWCLTVGEYNKTEHFLWVGGRLSDMSTQLYKLKTAGDWEGWAIR